MKMLYLGLMLGWLYVVSLAAGALLAKRVPVFSLARAIVVGTGLLAMFFIEHVHGFGSLRLAYPLLFVLACIILIKNQGEVWGWIKKDHAFFIGFAWAFFWRWSDPNIHTGTEHITDMFFIANYAQGGTLPPPNLWMAPYVFDCYYAFQHYAAALMARIFDIGPGYAYNLAFPLVFGYAASLVWETTVYHTRSKTYAYMLTFAVLMGATGVIPFIEWLRTPEFKDWPVIASMRFIGSAELRTTIAPFFAGGGREIMSYLAPQGPVYQAGTLSGNPLATAAGLATLRLADEGVYDTVDRRSVELQRAVSDALSAASVPHTVNSAGSLFSVFFRAEPVRNYEEAKAQDQSAFARFFHSMLDQGVALPPSAFEAWFLSAAHDEAAMGRILQALPGAARAAARS